MAAEMESGAMNVRYVISITSLTHDAMLVGALSFPESLSPTFDALSLSSFLFMWIATALILSQYRYKMGKIKYFTLMVMPLVYYIFPFQNYFGDAFFALLQSYPVFISLVVYPNF